jgi:hypothetical protein
MLIREDQHDNNTVNGYLDRYRFVTWPFPGMLATARVKLGVH